MCPVCKINSSILIGFPEINPEVLKYIKEEYKVVMCNNCSLYYISPEINFSIEEWQYLYNKNYFTPMSKWYERNRRKERLKRFENIVKYSVNEIKNFLDVGCGEGFCLLEAGNRGWDVYGVDITDNRIELAKNSKIKFFNSDLITAHLQDDFFDIIYLDSVLEHVVNPFEYLLEIKRILKKGGILYIGIPDEDSLLNDVKKLVYKITGKYYSAKLKPFKSPYHIIGFNKTSINLAVQKAGLEIIKSRNFACRLEFLKAKPFSKVYFHAILLLPVYFLAFIMRKEVYLEVYAQKS